MEPPASLRALQTVEILENILAFLPYDDLQNTRGVSKNWSNVVEGSIILQRQLFLTPDPTPRGRSIYIRTNDYPLNPDLLRDFADFHPPVEGEADYARLESHVTVPIMEVHPALWAEDGRNITGNLDDIGVSMSWTLKEMLSWSEGGRWQQTLITQPPCKSLFLDIFEDMPWRGRAPNKIELGEVTDEKGVRLGKVVKVLRDFVYPRYRAAKKARPRVNLERYKEVQVCVRLGVLPTGVSVQEARQREEVETRLEEEARLVATIATAEAQKEDDEADHEVADVPDWPPAAKASEKHPTALVQERDTKRRRIE